jgi:hypothetical protein
MSEEIADQSAFEALYVGHVAWERFESWMRGDPQFNMLVAWHSHGAGADCSPLCGCDVNLCPHHAPHFVMVQPRIKTVSFGWVHCDAEQDERARIWMARSGHALLQLAQQDRRELCRLHRYQMDNETAATPPPLGSE